MFKRFVQVHLFFFFSFVKFMFWFLIKLNQMVKYMHIMLTSWYISLLEYSFFCSFFLIGCFIYLFSGFNIWLIKIRLFILFWFGFYGFITVSYPRIRISWVNHNRPGLSQRVIISIFFKTIYCNLNILKVFHQVCIKNFTS
jgi:hypothetical protein